MTYDHKHELITICNNLYSVFKRFNNKVFSNIMDDYSKVVVRKEVAWLFKNGQPCFSEMLHIVIPLNNSLNVLHTSEIPQIRS